MRFLFLVMILILSFRVNGLNEIKSDSMTIIQKSKLIIGYCNNSDSINLNRFLDIKKVNDSLADNQMFIDMVVGFNEVGKKNKIFQDKFFQNSSEYCYLIFSDNFVLVAGSEFHVFEFNSKGKLVGFYTCVKKIE